MEVVATALKFHSGYRSQAIDSTLRPYKGNACASSNRLARWALTLSQYDYTLEYQKTADHANVNALSRLPAGQDQVQSGGTGGRSVYCLH